MVTLLASRFQGLHQFHEEETVTKTNHDHLEPLFLSPRTISAPEPSAELSSPDAVPLPHEEQREKIRAVAKLSVFGTRNGFALLSIALNSGLVWESTSGDKNENPYVLLVVFEMTSHETVTFIRRERVTSRCGNTRV